MVGVIFDVVMDILMMTHEWLKVMRRWSCHNSRIHWYLVMLHLCMVHVLVYHLVMRQNFSLLILGVECRLVNIMSMREDNRLYDVMITQCKNRLVMSLMTDLMKRLMACLMMHRLMAGHKSTMVRQYWHFMLNMLNTMVYRSYSMVQDRGLMGHMLWVYDVLHVMVSQSRLRVQMQLFVV